ncbi:MAG: WD40 repeat domain-containing protein [bacterium]
MENRYKKFNNYGLKHIIGHLIDSGNWDKVQKFLCDLNFIEAKCAAGMIYDLISDYNATLDGLPEAQERNTENKKRYFEIMRYTKEMIDYAENWNNSRNLHEKDPINYPMLQKGAIPFPRIIPSIKLLSNYSTKKDLESKKIYSRRLDWIDAFAQFVKSESQYLAKFAHMPSFCYQHAYNYAKSGPINDKVERIIPHKRDPLILRSSISRPTFYMYPACMQVLKGHTEPITALSITPNGYLTASGSGSLNPINSTDSTIRIWDTMNGKCLQVLKGHSCIVHDVKITPDSKRAISVGGLYDNDLRMWDINAGKCLHTLKCGTGKNIIKKLRITPDGRLAFFGIKYDIPQVLNLESGKCLYNQYWPLSPDTDHIPIHITPDGCQAISKKDNMLYIWDIDSGKCLRVLKGVGYGISVTPDARRAIWINSEHNLQVWDMESDEGLFVLKEYSATTPVNITADGKLAVSRGNDKTIRIWNLESGECVRILHGHFKEISVVDITPDGFFAVSGSYDNTLRVWNLANFECSLSPREKYSSIVCVAPDGRWAVSEEDKILQVWNLESEKCIKMLQGHSSPIKSIDIILNSFYILSADDKTLRLWDIEGNKCLENFEGDIYYDGRIAHRTGPLSVTLDGRYALTIASNGLHIWDLDFGVCLSSSNSDISVTRDVCISPDGILAVTAGLTFDGGSGICEVWNIETKKCLLSFIDHRDCVNSVAVTADGRFAVSCSGGRFFSTNQDFSLRIWELRTGKCLHLMKGHSGPVNKIIVTSDSRYALSSSDDGTIRLWNLSNGECIAVLGTDTPLSCISNLIFDNKIVACNKVGEVFVVYLKNLSLDIPFVTAIRRWIFSSGNQKGHWDDSITSLCPHCGQRFTVTEKILGTIDSIVQEANLELSQSPCLEIPDEAWNESRLISECPYCQKQLKFNPFLLDKKNRKNKDDLDVKKMLKKGCMMCMLEQKNNPITWRILDTVCCDEHKPIISQLVKMKNPAGKDLPWQRV